MLPGETPTTADKQDRAKAHIDAIIAGCWNTMVIAQHDGIDAFWNNKDGLTPQQVADKYGTRAGALFAFNTALVTFLLTQAAARSVNVIVKPPTNAFTVNQDGTVTISNDPYVP